MIDGKVVGELEVRGSKSPCCRRVDRAGGGVTEGVKLSTVAVSTVTAKRIFRD